MILGWEDPLGKGMATHSRILAWRIHGERSLAGYSPLGRNESDTAEQLTGSERVTGSPYRWREALLSLTSENTREVASLDPLSFLTLSGDTNNFGLPQH